MSIYKACDIRGEAGKELTPALFRRLGRGIARLMGERRQIVVGGDLRLSTPALQAALIAGLTDAGRTVHDVGAAPTPLVYFTRRRLAADACAIVTASHNPPQYNGLKFMIGRSPVMPEDMAWLQRFVESPAADASSAAPGRVIVVDGAPAYEQWVRQAGPRADGRGRRPVRVVVDAGNGAYSELAPRVLALLPGVAVEPLFCKPDGAFPNRDPNCAVPEHLDALARRVQKTGADLGIAFDGDGDRVAFTDERGGVLAADEVMVLLLRFLGEAVRGQKIVYDLKSSRVVACEAERLGAAPLMERSGHAFIKSRMIREDALLGGEVSGHYFYRELEGGDDGLFSALLGIRLLQAADGPLSGLRAGVPPRFITPDLRIAWPPAAARDLLQRVKAAFPEERRCDLDGIRITFPKGWGLLRISITEPKITLRFEGEDAAALRATIDAFLDAVPELRGAVDRALERAQPPA